MTIVAGSSGGSGGGNIFSKALGALPGPVRTIGRGALDLLDTFRAAPLAASYEVTNLLTGKGLSPSEFVRNTRNNISAYEALHLDQLNAALDASGKRPSWLPSWAPKVAGLGIDLGVGAATMPGKGTIPLGDAARGQKALREGAAILGRNAVETATLGELQGLGTARSLGTAAAEATPGASRWAVLGSKPVQDAATVSAKATVKGLSSLTQDEMATLGRARTMTLGGRAIPGTEKIATLADKAISSMLPGTGMTPKEALVRTFTRQGIGGAADNFAQKLDSFGATGTRLRAAAIRAVDTGDNTKLLAELQSTALRGRALGAGSVLAKEFLDGNTQAQQNGLRQIITNTTGASTIDKALAPWRTAADRGALDLVASVTGRAAPGNVMDQIVQQAKDLVHNADPNYWTMNPERWDAAQQALIQRAHGFATDIGAAQGAGALKGVKLAAAGQRDAISNVLAGWVSDTAKELSAARIADPEALSRLAVAADVTAIHPGAPTIDLGKWGTIDLNTFKRVTGTFDTAVPDKINAFTKHVQGVTNLFRASAIASPAFSNRNFVGGVFNNWAHGVTLGDARWATKQFDTMVTGGAADPAYRNFYQRMGDYMHSLTRGVETDPFSPKIQRGAQTVQQALDRTGLSARGVMTGTVQTQAPVEMVLRGAAFKRGLSLGLNEEGAWAFAQKIHFDYQDLSQFDVAAKKAAPFYTWASRNLPAQAELMARNQGLGRQVETAMLNSQQREQGSGFPPFIKGSAFSLGGNRVLDLGGLPSADLTGLLDANRPGMGALRDLSTQLNPAIKAPLELLSGVQAGTERKATPARVVAEFLPPISLLARLFPPAVPSDVRSKSLLPGYRRYLGIGMPADVRQYSSTK